jgi:hypothetical protein
MSESLHGHDDIHKAAKGLYEQLPDDPFGDEPPKEPTGPDPEEREPAGAESEEITDAEAATEIADEEEEASEEDGEEADEDSEEAEPEGDDEGEEAPVATEDPRFTVRVDGEDVEVTLAELQAGYSRTASWTRKSQKLAKERQEFERVSAEVSQEREGYRQKLYELEAQLQATLPDKPSTDDPQAWIRHHEKQQELAAVQTERANLENKMRADYERQKQEHLQHQASMLLEALPEWEDAAVADKERNDIVTYAMRMGFTEEDIENIEDHRVILLFKKALERDSMDAVKTKVKEKTKKAPVLKPGSNTRRKSKADSKAEKAQRSRRDQLAKRGSVKDAAAFFQDFVDLE